MRRTGLILGIFVSATIASTACSRTPEAENHEAAAPATTAQATGDRITVTGCLTGAADRAAFVVTADRNALTSGALHAGDGETPTYTYELTGNTADLAAHVGRQVAVTGRLDDDREDEVKVESEEKTTLPATQSGKDKVTPAIETEAEMAINIRRLEVASVQPTGQPCNASAQPR